MVVLPSFAGASIVSMTSPVITRLSTRKKPIASPPMSRPARIAHAAHGSKRLPSPRLRHAPHHEEEPVADFGLRLMRPRLRRKFDDRPHVGGGLDVPQPIAQLGGARGA